MCLSAAACLHYCTDPDVNWGNGRGCPLVVDCWVDLQSGHGLRCYDNITRRRNVSECMLVLALCLVKFVLQWPVLPLLVDSLWSMIYVKDIGMHEHCVHVDITSLISSSLIFHLHTNKRCLFGRVCFYVRTCYIVSRRSSVSVRDRRGRRDALTRTHREMR